MKHLLLLLGLIHSSFQLQASHFENSKIGLQFDHADYWEAQPMEEAPPYIAFLGINKQDQEQMFIVMVIPTVENEVQKKDLASWTHNMTAEVPNMSPDKIKKSQIEKQSSGDWFYTVFEASEKDYMYLYSINKYGYNYTFMISSSMKTNMKKELKLLMKSVKFSTPDHLSEVQKSFKNLTLKEAVELKTPSGFEWSNDTREVFLPPFVRNVYGHQLSQGAADYALVSDAFLQQLFCLNIQHDTVMLSDMACKMIANVASKKMGSNGTRYEEVHNEPWDKMAETVFLTKFRLHKEMETTTHYIFYCRLEGEMLHLRFKVPTMLEKELEASFYAFVQANLE